MSHTAAITAKRTRNVGPTKARWKSPGKMEPRYTVNLPAELAKQVQRYAEAADTTMNKAIATLVRLGIESQEHRKRDFFRKLRANLANDDPGQRDQMVEEFRALILGH